MFEIIQKIIVYFNIPKISQLIVIYLILFSKIAYLLILYGDFISWLLVFNNLGDKVESSFGDKNFFKGVAMLAFLIFTNVALITVKISSFSITRSRSFAGRPCKNNI